MEHKNTHGQVDWKTCFVFRGSAHPWRHPRTNTHNSGPRTMNVGISHNMDKTRQAGATLLFLLPPLLQTKTLTQQNTKKTRTNLLHNMFRVPDVCASMAESAHEHAQLWTTKHECLHSAQYGQTRLDNMIRAPEFCASVAASAHERTQLRATNHECRHLAQYGQTRLDNMIRVPEFCASVAASAHEHAQLRTTKHECRHSAQYGQTRLDNMIRAPEFCASVAASAHEHAQLQATKHECRHLAQHGQTHRQKNECKHTQVWTTHVVCKSAAQPWRHPRTNTQLRTTKHECRHRAHH